MRKQILLPGVLLAGLLMMAPRLFTDSHTLKAQNTEEAEEAARKEEKELKKFLAEMETLIKAAQDAGFPEQDIREMTITRKGKTINVWEFLEQEKLKRKREERLRFVPRDRYLTVMDITSELQSLESRDLDTLRKKMVFMGAEEK